MQRFGRNRARKNQVNAIPVTKWDIFATMHDTVFARDNSSLNCLEMFRSWSFSMFEIKKFVSFFFRPKMIFIFFSAKIYLNFRAEERKRKKLKLCSRISFRSISSRTVCSKSETIFAFADRFALLNLSSQTVMTPFWVQSTESRSEKLFFFFLDSNLRRFSFMHTILPPTKRSTRCSSLRCLDSHADRSSEFEYMEIALSCFTLIS